MTARLIILFLACVLLWTGFPIQDQWNAGARMGTALDAQKAAGQVQSRHLQEGSINEHHLDEQPTQSFAEGGTDLSEALPSLRDGQVSVWTSGWAAPDVMTSRLWPYLDGPQRPPRPLQIFA